MATAFRSKWSCLCSESELPHPHQEFGYQNDGGRCGQEVQDGSDEGKCGHGRDGDQYGDDGDQCGWSWWRPMWSGGIVIAGVRVWVLPGGEMCRSTGGRGTHRVILPTPTILCNCNSPIPLFACITPWRSNWLLGAQTGHGASVPLTSRSIAFKCTWPSQNIFEFHRLLWEHIAISKIFSKLFKYL